jgi:nucleotide-binding universal stress UspA family protein
MQGDAMYRHVLIATDGSELAQKAVVHGLALAKELGAKVTAITVTEPLASMVAGEPVYPTQIDEYEKAMASSAKKILAPVCEAADAKAVACEGIYLKDQYPAEGIIETAKARGCDLIVMASHGRRGVARLCSAARRPGSWPRARSLSAFADERATTRLSCVQIPPSPEAAHSPVLQYLSLCRGRDHRNICPSGRVARQ